METRNKTVVQNITITGRYRIIQDRNYESDFDKEVKKLKNSRNHRLKGLHDYTD